MFKSNSLNAVYTAVVAFLGSIVVVMVGDMTPGDLTWSQWLTALLAALTVGGSAYGFTRGNVAGSQVAVLMDGNMPIAGPASSVTTGEVLSTQDMLETVLPLPVSGGTTGDF